MDTRRHPAVRDASNYVLQIKNAFQYTRPGIYDEFLNIMHAFVIHHSTKATTIQWVNLLDVHYLDIIYGFKQFLPDREAERLVDLRILYLVLQNWLRRSRDVEWTHPDWSRIWETDSIGER
ncbi:uncharacterized protein Bfra_000520 [Botrytis fragariae]|uniref:Uncharacterized protein n=1 Tax=Botrytis fragariae TaxID=1964551 RepID=A0A8H6EN85_9HELO|nr:uncharacterized protein Bfra_000520 [Botrytis fragariae]KAF5878354.1 hypothetical protein Bfra_000520 [Botrytis fragariae]